MANRNKVSASLAGYGAHLTCRYTPVCRTAGYGASVGLRAQRLVQDADATMSPDVWGCDYLALPPAALPHGPAGALATDQPGA